MLEALGPAAHLAFVGDGPYRPELEAHFAGTQTTFTVGSLTKLLRRMLSAAIEVRHALYGAKPRLRVTIESDG